MDVAIYEVSKSDLLKFGNQIGSEAQLTNLGGTTPGVVGLGGNELFGTLGRAATALIPGAFGAGIVLPAANLTAFQSKGNTKLPDDMWRRAVERTGGRFYTAADEATILRAINEIDKASAGTVEIREYSTRLPRFSPFALGAAALWTLALALRLVVPQFQTFP